MHTVSAEPVEEVCIQSVRSLLKKCVTVSAEPDEEICIQSVRSLLKKCAYSHCGAC